jgi:hypothetical protein
MIISKPRPAQLVEHYNFIHLVLLLTGVAFSRRVL